MNRWLLLLVLSVPLLLGLNGASPEGCPIGNVATQGYCNGAQQYQYTDGSAFVNVWPEQHILWSAATGHTITNVCVSLDDGSIVGLEPVDYGGWNNKTGVNIDLVVLTTEYRYKCYVPFIVK